MNNSRLAPSLIVNRILRFMFILLSKNAPFILTSILMVPLNCCGWHLNRRSFYRIYGAADVLCSNNYSQWVHQSKECEWELDHDRNNWVAFILTSCELTFGRFWTNFWSNFAAFLKFSIVFCCCCRRYWTVLVDLMVLASFRNASRPSAHFTRRAKGNWGCHRYHNVEEEANVRAMEEHFDGAMRLGHHHHTRNIGIRLLHNCQPIAHIHETHFTLRY